MKNCGISRWDNPDVINSQLQKLTKEPIWEVSKDYYENEILKYYDEKCAASKAIFEEAKEYIPGGVQHNLAFNKPFPVCFDKAEGAYLYDRDGNAYIDFLQAGGPTILGSNYDPVKQAAIELINTCGPVTGLLHESELLIAKEINKHMPSVEMFRMLGSGTESVMAAMRIARIATKKKHIIKIGGAYHGWSDQMAVSYTHLTGRFSQLKGLMRQRRDNPACTDTNIALFSLMEKAACQGLYLIECFDHSLVRGETLCEDFDRNFE